MFAKSTLAVIAVITMIGVASPALAQNGKTSPSGSHNGRQQSQQQVTDNQQNGRLDPHSSALCGGGSAGYNRTLAAVQ